MIYADIIFLSKDIKNIRVELPFNPRIGETIRFENGAVKYNNGVEVEENSFNVISIDWEINKLKFYKLSVYVDH